MNNNIQKLIDGYLDETLSGDQETELLHWLKSCPSNAKIFASAIQFHNKLHDLIQTEKTLILHPMHETQIFPKVNIRPEKNYWTQTSITAGIASMIGIIIFVYWGFLLPTQVQLQRLNASQTQPHLFWIELIKSKLWIIHPKY